MRTTVSGTLMRIASDGLPAGALAGATVIIGPVPIDGATAPARAPAGDALAQTGANGAFSVTLDATPAPPSTGEPFVLPQNNILDFTAPSTGYYVAAFAPGSDGRTAGTAMPLHHFLAAGSTLALHVATIAAFEAAALNAINADRAQAGAGALTFDTTAADVARRYAGVEAAGNYTCHYDAQNVGPASRYLAGGGIGLTGETLALTYGPDAESAMQNAENSVLAERTATPPGGHYLNLTDPSHLWAGIGAVAVPAAPGFFSIDEEFVTPNAVSAVTGVSGYLAGTTCPAGVVNNGS